MQLSESENEKTYVIRDGSRIVSKPYTDPKRARSVANRKNLEYGAHKYHVISTDLLSKDTKEDK